MRFAGVRLNDAGIETSSTRHVPPSSAKAVRSLSQRPRNASSTMSRFVCVKYLLTLSAKPKWPGAA